MRGYRLYNFPAFDEAERALKLAGADPVSPAAMDREAGFDPSADEATPDFVRAAMIRDVKAIADCDSILLLKGWEYSEGAFKELQVAKILGLEVLLESDWSDELYI